MSTRLPKLAAKHPARLSQQVMRHSLSSSFKPARLSHMLRRSSLKHFGLMNHWLEGMIGFRREAQIQEGNINVV